MSLLSLNIIGAGRVGQTLGRLWQDFHYFEVKGILNATLESGQRAVDFIGAGLACQSFQDLPAAEITLIATADTQIPIIAQALSQNLTWQPSTIVFHCSGVLPSSVLIPLKPRVKSVASTHPLVAFAHPISTRDFFKGVCCSFEGDDAVYPLLQAAWQGLGTEIFSIPTHQKTAYHAASVMASNAVVALLDVAYDLYMAAGLTRQQAAKVMQPLVEKTIADVFAHDTVKALTGPIARGDAAVIQQHVSAMPNEHLKDIYKALGMKLIQLSQQKGEAATKNLERIEEILDCF